MGQGHTFDKCEIYINHTKHNSSESRIECKYFLKLD